MWNIASIQDNFRDIDGSIQDWIILMYKIKICHCFGSVCYATFYKFVYQSLKFRIKILSFEWYLACYNFRPYIFKSFFSRFNNFNFPLRNKNTKMFEFAHVYSYFFSFSHEDFHQINRTLIIFKRKLQKHNQRTQHRSNTNIALETFYIYEIPIRGAKIFINALY